MFVPAPFSERIAACDVVESPQAVNASDHFPVVADLVIDETSVRSARAGES